jgi:hypothetical protein
MSTEMSRFVKEDPNPIMKNPGDSERPDESTSVTPPIEFVTDNGFCILRRSELEPATVDSPSNCHFLVQQPNGEERNVSVEFVAAVIAQVQHQRRQALPGTSDFWLTLAEQQLAHYVLQNNCSPADGRLVVSLLSSHDLMLAARWRD